MIKWIKHIQRQRKIRRLLKELLNEALKNLETFYVMDQRGVLKPFSLDVWKKTKDFPEISQDKTLQSYADALKHYNALFKDMQEFEAFYNASLDNRTKENAGILHEKKEILKEKALFLEDFFKKILWKVNNLYRRFFEIK